MKNKDFLECILRTFYQITPLESKCYGFAAEITVFLCRMKFKLYLVRCCCFTILENSFENSAQSSSCRQASTLSLQKSSPYFHFLKFSFNIDPSEILTMQQITASYAYRFAFSADIYFLLNFLIKC